MLVIVICVDDDDDVAVSIEVAYESDVDDNDKYSLDCAVFSLLVLKIPFVVVETNSVVGTCDSNDEVRGLSVLNRVVNIGVSDVTTLVFTVVGDCADNVLVCLIEESVLGNDTAAMVVTTVEVDDTNTSIVVVLIVLIVVPSVELELKRDSVDAE